jgi:Zn-finger nucleic acid-binding protein
MSDSLPCPRCARPLVAHRRQTQKCVNCLGLFVPRTSMTMVLEALRDGHDIETAMTPYRGTVSNEPVVVHEASYKKCPECLDIMNRTELILGAGVVVDMCMVDGVWFDRGELSRASTFIREQAREEGRDAGRQAAFAKIAAALGRYFKV